MSQAQEVEIEMLGEMLLAIETHAQKLTTLIAVDDPAWCEAVGFLLKLSSCLAEHRDALAEGAS